MAEEGPEPGKYTEAITWFSPTGLGPEPGSDPVSGIDENLAP